MPAVLNPQQFDPCVAGEPRTAIVDAAMPEVTRSSYRDHTVHTSLRTRQAGTNLAAASAVPTCHVLLVTSARAAAIGRLRELPRYTFAGSTQSLSEPALSGHRV